MKFISKLKAFFKELWLARDMPLPELTPVPEIKKKQKISRDALSRAALTGAEIPVIENSFEPAKPPPGVVPEGQKPAMAMDENINVIGTWALSSVFKEGLGFLGYPYLAELSLRAEYRKISESYAKEMTRKWIRLQSVGKEDNGDKTDKLAKLEAAMKRYKVQAAFRRAIELDGFFGRSHIYIDLGNDDNDELQTSIGNGSNQITLAKVTKGSLKALRVIEPVWTYPNAYNSSDPLKSDYYKPSSWFVQGRLIHSTRLLTFVGRPVSDLLKPAFSFGGLSLSQMAKPYIDNWLRTRQSVSDILHSFSVFVLKMDMTSVLSGETGDDFFNRLELFNRTRDNRGIMAIDKDKEDFANVSAPLGSIDHLQAQSQEQMSAVSGIPLVKLLGITPSGLNASSDGEIRCFYDTIEAEQEAQLTDNLSLIINILQLSEFGEIDPDIGFKFEPLWTLDAAALANKRKVEADTDIELINGGVIDPQEARTRLAADEDSPYASLDLGKEIVPPDVDNGEGGFNPFAQGQEDKPEESF